jgi:RNA polymerase sporulation-specific sigma factor
MSGGQLFALLDRAQNGDDEACEQVLLENSGLIWSIVRRYYGCGVETDDLYQLGCIGFIKAVKGFDLTYGTQFSTYAVPVILGEIKKLFRDGGTVKVSRSLKELSLRINAAREHHSKLCGAEPTLSQLAEELGESVENITLAIQAAQPAVSLTPENREESDRQIDIPVESPEEELADKIGLAEVLKSLPEEDRLIIQLRFYGGKTQSDTAKLLHTTQVQISRRERKILKVMRDRLLDE